MLSASTNIVNMIDSPVRKITARVEVYNASALVDTFTYSDKLISVSIERVCEEGKFFGFGICQKLNVKILDSNREVDYLTTQHSIKIAFGTGSEYVYTTPTFYITQSRRDENTNELTIYGYDLIYDAAARYTSELPISAPYSPLDLAAVCATVLGASGTDIKGLGSGETCFSKVYQGGANFEGTESLRDALNDIAEATQTIYYVDANNKLVFKRLDKDASADLSITKAKYSTLDSSNSRRLGTIVHVTELGDNISASTTQTGSTQYVRDNAFWTMLDSTEISTMVEDAVAAVGGLTINQFECSWRGNFLLEIGDKIALTTKDDSIVMSFVLDDTIEYNGAFSEQTGFTYDDDEAETADNPSSLGDVLKQTYAKVDKAEKQIELVAGDVQENSSKISAISLNTDSILASVEEINKNTNNRLDATDESIVSLTERLNTTISADAIDIKIQEVLNDGVTSITTERGFTLNDDGLTISHSDSDMTTLVTEDGITVSKGSQVMLTANNQGVDAANLHANTYLIIGEYSRFEDYGNGRTGCFWVG
jgi:hypothetical protein